MGNIERISNTKNYRVRRPKQYDSFLNLLKDKDEGVFTTLKSALVFAAAVGFKHKIKLEFLEPGEPINYNLFNDFKDKPFIYAMALTEFDDVSYLHEDKFIETIRLFEEYAAGGLQYLDGILDKTNLKESIEVILADKRDDNIIDTIADDW